MVRKNEKVSIPDDAVKAMDASEQWVSAIMDDMRDGKEVAAIYGINTGFWSLAGRRAFDTVEDASELSRRLAIPNTSGVGRMLDEEGLALTNGTSFSTAQAALALADAENLRATAQLTAAMSIEALAGFGDSFIPQIHEARGHAGQIQVATRIRELLAGSEFIDGDIDRDPVRQPPQDAYSLRAHTRSSEQ